MTKEQLRQAILIDGRIDELKEEWSALAEAMKILREQYNSYGKATYVKALVEHLSKAKPGIFALDTIIINVCKEYEQEVKRLEKELEGL